MMKAKNFEMCSENKNKKTKNSKKQQPDLPRYWHQTL